jgi:hypothetical protein
MRLYNTAGDRTAALRQYEICAAALEKEFGVQPTERTVTLLEQIRVGQPEAHGAWAESTVVPGPDHEIVTKVFAELSHIRAYVSTLQQEMDQLKQVLRHPTS